MRTEFGKEQLYVRVGLMSCEREQNNINIYVRRHWQVSMWIVI